ncbi:MAG: class I SAM-dependent methyltransferase [Stackebrandtia sp.]
MHNYDVEVTRYDRTRGGDARAMAAAYAVTQLLPESNRLILDLAGGTAVMSRFLIDDDRTVLVADASAGMLRVAATRLPGQVLRANATRLPLASRQFDAVSCVWLLHLLPAETVAKVVAEINRILRPGGRFITTVDKDAHQDGEDTDVADVLRALRDGVRIGDEATDSQRRLAELTSRQGMRLSGESGFAGVGQGKSPAELSELVPHWFHDAPARLIDQAQRRLTALPDQETPRPDPLYHVQAFAKPELSGRTGPHRDSTRGHGAR